MRIAVLVKQVPRFEAMRLGPDGRLQRDGLELELNPYCRRAVSKGVELAADGGTCTVFTLGPPAAEDVLREAVAWGATDAVLITDPAFAGSDTLATARALAAALRREGPFDLILAGRNSVDADTGQVGPEVAELLGLPFLASVRRLEIDGTTVRAHCEHDDGWVDAETSLPALLSCAERLCEPAKVDPPGRAAVDASLLRHLTAADLGPGPWGQGGSPTTVGAVRQLSAPRDGRVLVGALDAQVREAVAVLRDRGALDPGPATDGADIVAEPSGGDRRIVVVLEADRPQLARELLGGAARLASDAPGTVVAVGPDPDPDWARWGADEITRLTGSSVEEDVAAALGASFADRAPWAVLAGGTVWGREVLARVAARCSGGLTGDAVDVDIHDGELVGWKPAFGGSLVAAVTATSSIRLVTVRPGVLAMAKPRAARSVPTTTLDVPAAGRVRHLASGREDEIGRLARAGVVIGIGSGVAPDDYPALDGLLAALDAELAATRKVTDKGFQPRSRQVGITGLSIGPRLYVALGVSGKFNHMVGVRGAGMVLAINVDAGAPVFAGADLGIVADWRDAVPLLVDALTA